jgi:hypothetical protein
MPISTLSVAVLLLFIIVLILIGFVIVYVFLYGPHRKMHPGVWEIIPSVLSDIECTTIINEAITAGFFPPVLFNGYSNVATLNASTYNTVSVLLNRISAYTGYPRGFIGNVLEVIRQSPGDSAYQLRGNGLCTNPYDRTCRAYTFMGYRLMTIIIPLNRNFTGGEIYFSRQKIAGYVDQGDALIIRNSVRNNDGTCTYDPYGDYDMREVWTGVRYYARIVIRGECTNLPPSYHYAYSSDWYR